MAGGRPMTFQSKEELQSAVDGYFNNTKKPTLAGLAYDLCISRQTLYNYEENDEFFDIIKRAREKVEATYEERLVYENNPTGVIFALKNMSWKDKTEQDLTVQGGVILTGVRPKENDKVISNGVPLLSNGINGKDH